MGARSSKARSERLKRTHQEPEVHVSTTIPYGVMFFPDMRNEVSDSGGTTTVPDISPAPVLTAGSDYLAMAMIGDSEFVRM